MYKHLYVATSEVASAHMLRDLNSITSDSVIS